MARTAPDDIRALTPADAALWRAIRLEALLAAPTAFGATHADWADRPLEDFAAWLEKCRILAVIADGRAVGTAGWFLRAPDRAAHRAALIAVYLQPDVRGQGLLDRLVEAVIQDLPSEVLQLELEVVEDNAAAIGAYTRLGFETVGRMPRAMWVDGRFLDRLIMVRHLDA